MLSSIEDALQDVKQGKPIIVVDARDREDEGDLIIAAEFVTTEIVNFMIKHCGGLIGVMMLPERLRELSIPLMVPKNQNRENTRCKFCVSVDLIKGNTTGIPASERARTIQALINPESKPEDFAQPGHIFPVQAEPGGVLDRPGHTESAIDLCRLTDLYPAGVWCEILDKDGESARGESLKRFAHEHDFKVIAISDLIDYLS